MLHKTEGEMDFYGLACKSANDTHIMIILNAVPTAACHNSWAKKGLYIFFAGGYIGNG